MLTPSEIERSRTDAELKFRVYEDSKHITVSKIKKAKLNITIHPYLKEEFKKICGEDLENTSVAEELEKYIRLQVENKKGKKLIFR